MTAVSAAGCTAQTLLPEGDPAFILVQHLEPLVSLVPPAEEAEGGGRGGGVQSAQFTRMQLALANREARLREAERIAGLATWEVNVRTVSLPPSPMLPFHPRYAS